MHLQGRYRISEGRVCEVLSLNRSTCQYRHHVWSYDFVYDQTLDGRAALMSDGGR